MEYQKLGRTNIEVSRICLGTMTWGQQNTLDEAMAQMDYAVSRGINFFDVAEMYPVPPKAETQGSTEKYIGEWFASTGKRSEIVLATKVTGRGEKLPDWKHLRGGPRLSRDHIRQAVEGSLERLQTDYIDLYQVHWPERNTNYFGRLGYKPGPDHDPVSIEETLSALAELVDEGLVKQIGISNETPWGVMEYLRLSRELALPRIASIQNPYNLLNRSFEVGLAEMSMREQVSLLAYSPMAFGVLSGKYLNDQRPEGSRLALFDRFSRYVKEYAVAATEAYVALAERNGLNPAQMALAYVNSRPFVTSNIIGATTMEQLEANIDSYSVELSSDVIQEIDDIHKHYSNPAP